MQMMDGRVEEGLATLRRCVSQAESLHPPGSEGHTTALPQQLEILSEGLQRSGDLMGARDLLHRSMGLRKVAFHISADSYTPHQKVQKRPNVFALQVSAVVTKALPAFYLLGPSAGVLSISFCLHRISGKHKPYDKRGS